MSLTVFSERGVQSKSHQGTEGGERRTLHPIYALGNDTYKSKVAIGVTH